MENEEMCDISPLVDELIGEMERESMSWPRAICELIDNSYDAKASQVELTWGKKFFEVRDDGVGCDSPEKMLQKGFTTKRGSRNVGRYGVGLKHASFHLCGKSGTTQIMTVAEGTFREVKVRWGDLLSLGKWQVHKPHCVPMTDAVCADYDLLHKRGTTIRFTGCTRQKPAGQKFQAMLDRLSHIFFPALESGRQIIIDDGKSRRHLQPPEPEQWSRSIDHVLTVQGKKARLRAGIKTDTSKSKRRGLSYYFMHRVIIEDTGMGCGDYSVSQISGTVELDESWKLSQNKTEISDADLDLLQRAVLNAMRPLLEEASTRSRDVQFQNLIVGVENQLNEQITKGRENRPGNRGNKGAVAPKNSGRQRKTAEHVSGAGECAGPTGNNPIKPRVGKVKLDIINDSSKPIYDVDLPGNCVLLNRHYPLVQRILDGDNKDAVLVIVGTAYGVAHSMANSVMRVIPGLPSEKGEKLIAHALTAMVGFIEQETDLAGKSAA